jgi:hypothetical protein
MLHSPFNPSQPAVNALPYTLPLEEAEENLPRIIIITMVLWGTS